MRRIPGSRSLPGWPLAALRDACLVAALASGLGLAVNALRPGGLPLLAEKEYEILVPCSEVQGEADALEPDHPALREARTLLLDARSAEEFQAWHAPGATHLPYDYLEPVSPGALKRVLQSGAARVVVIGDGADPDSGEQLARELAGKGIRHVGYVRGGAAALRQAGAAGRAP
ncbi:MAG TPA: rhodanese-like domain-containing protein [Myxococcota bacterium]|nr:rhodanese-like domain-containing protein [Myxococcota bacterium]HRY91854.1 rhodanese-like domain-containing protein [Myxococcota bacterium]HSA20559.1 rhodanese-like domain-containing protein [Myxococcota bacterium]